MVAEITIVLHTNVKRLSEGKGRMNSSKTKRPESTRFLFLLQNTNETNISSEPSITYYAQKTILWPSKYYTSVRKSDSFNIFHIRSGVIRFFVTKIFHFYKKNFPKYFRLLTRCSCTCRVCGLRRFRSRFPGKRWWMVPGRSVSLMAFRPSPSSFEFKVLTIFVPETVVLYLQVYTNTYEYTDTPGA